MARFSGDGRQSGRSRWGPVAKPLNRFYVDATKHQPGGSVPTFENHRNATIIEF
jgi:hypothetical protein